MAPRLQIPLSVLAAATAALGVCGTGVRGSFSKLSDYRAAVDFGMGDCTAVTVINTSSRTIVPMSHTISLKDLEEFKTRRPRKRKRRRGRRQ